MITYPKIILDVGELVEFTNEDIVSASILQEINPVSITLPISTFEVKLYSEDGRFSIFSGGEFYDSLSKRQPMLVYESIEGTDHFLGKFYLNTWENSGEYELDFTCFDIIGVLNATEYDGGFYPNNITLEDILSDLLDPLNIEFSIIDEASKTVELRGWIPPGNYRDALQQICFAAGVTAQSYRSKILKIGAIILPGNNVDEIYDRTILQTDKAIDQAVILLPLVTSIELLSHEYAKGAEFRATEGGDERIDEGNDYRITYGDFTLVSETIFSEILLPGVYKIVFDKPYYNVVATGTGYLSIYRETEGGDERVSENDEYRIVAGDYEYGPNCLYLTVYEPGGAILVTGYPWIDSSRSYLFEESDLGEDITENVLCIKEATMISSENAQSILNKLRDYYRQRYSQNITLFAKEADTNFYGAGIYGTGVYSALKNVGVGDTVLVDVYSTYKLLALIEKVDLDLTGGFKNNLDVVGIEYTT